MCAHEFRYTARSASIDVIGGEAPWFGRWPGGILITWELWEIMGVVAICNAKGTRVIGAQLLGLVCISFSAPSRWGQNEKCIK